MEIRVFNKEIIRVLTYDGWFEGRNINIDDVKSCMINRGIALNQPAEKILKSFGGLTIHIHPECFINMRFEIFELVQDCEFVSEFKTIRNDIVKFFAKTNDISPIGLLSFDEDGIDSDDIYISGDGNVILYSTLGIYEFINFNDFLERIYTGVVGELIAKNESIDEHFPDSTSGVVMSDQFRENLISILNS